MLKVIGTWKYSNEACRWLFFLPKLRYQMEKCSVLLVACEGIPLFAGGFPSQRPVTRSFDVFFDVRLNIKLGKEA